MIAETKYIATTGEIAERIAAEFAAIRAESQAEIARWKNEAFRSANQCAEMQKLIDHITEQNQTEFARLTRERAEAREDRELLVKSVDLFLSGMAPGYSGKLFTEKDVAELCAALAAARKERG